MRDPGAKLRSSKVACDRFSDEETQKSAENFVVGAVFVGIWAGTGSAGVEVRPAFAVVRAYAHDACA